MPMPRGIGIIDTMMSVGLEGTAESYERIRPLLRDEASQLSSRDTLVYLFKDNMAKEHSIEHVLQQMDQYGVQRSMIPVSDRNATAQRALREHPDRFFADYEVDPNQGMEALRTIDRMKRDWDIKAVSTTPSMVFPQVPLGDKRMYPIYARCIELDLPFVTTAGVPGPRVPMAPQDPSQLDEVCWFWPELRIVVRHGAEPWSELLVKLMLKYPGLHFATTGFAPKYYPKPVIEFANTRGADKVIYGGHFPMGLTLDRIMHELQDLPLRDHVWPKFLRENSLRVFKLSA
ncbi:MAG TPA: amidohydrolase family protein [Myxococcota bacterium]|nr:amidohydrolase family protein [Myxococcota bacterium]